MWVLPVFLVVVDEEIIAKASIAFNAFQAVF